MGLGSLARIGTVLMLVVAVGGSTASCSDSCGDVNCGAGDTLFLKLEQEISTSDTVEVCFGNACGTAEMYGGDGTLDEGEVPYTALGRWSETKDEAVTVKVRDAGGAARAERTSVPEKRGSCCGDYWTATA